MSKWRSLTTTSQKKAYNNCHKLCLSSRLARCKNHLWRSVTANIEGEQLPGPIVTCNSAFGGTFYAGSSAGGSAPANDSEVEQEASIQDLVANTCQILAPCCFSSPIIYVA